MHLQDDYTGDNMIEKTGKGSEISTRKRDRKPEDAAAPGQIRTRADLDALEVRLDIWRILLVDLVYLLSSYFVDVQYWEGAKSEKDTFDQLSRILAKLSRMSDHDGTVLIRFRGFPGGAKASEKSDYTVLFGNISVDRAITNAVTYRQGIHMLHLSGRIDRSFGIFSQHGINTLYLKLPEATAPDLERLRICLHIISHYKQALKTNQPIVLKKEGREINLPLVYDDQNQPDLNLILLAGLNGLTPRASERLVKNVAAWMQQPDQMETGEQYVGVYNTIFRIKNLREKLIKPPIEINNVKWLKLDGSQKLVVEDADEFSDENLVPQAIRDAFGEISDHSEQYPESIAAFNFENIDPKQVSRRLQQAFDLIDVIETRSEGWEILEEVIQSIQGRFELAGEGVFDNMIVDGDVLKVLTEGKEIVIEGLSPGLAEKIGFYKERAAFKTQMRKLAGYGIDFDTRDYRKIADEIGLPASDIQHFVTILKACFDDQGHFLKSVFDSSISEFARFPDKTFTFLWQYLKQPLERKDRVAFLNSMQMLIGRCKSAKSAIRILMADLCHDPGRVSLADRNAPMLACMLLRKFNKEMNLDIEVTPEEVLWVREGLDLEVARAAAGIIESNPRIFLEKIQTVQHKVAEALAPGASETTESLPLRYLLSLEREIHLLLALVGGETALAVIRNAARRYGNPFAEIYRSEASRQNLWVLLQQLKVAIRCLGRIGEKTDLAILADIKKRKNGFLRLEEGAQYEKLILRIMDWADAARQNIFPNEALGLSKLTEKTVL